VNCAVCQRNIPAGTGGKPYRIGSVHGHLCSVCARSMEASITAWIHKRMSDVENERQQEEKIERRRQEKAAAALLTKEIAHQRLANLVAEGLPIATRSEMARARRRSAA
jgi:hypothetical protein